MSESQMTPEERAANKRRHELIRKKHKGTSPLSKDEQDELNALSEALGQRADQVFTDSIRPRGERITHDDSQGQMR